MLEKYIAFALMSIFYASYLGKKYIQRRHGITALGVAFFIVAMLTMEDNWRAGIPEKGKLSWYRRAYTG